MADQVQAALQQQDNSWRTPSFRQKVINQIDEAMHQSANAINKSSHEMENHIYQKSKTREEYLHLVARLIIHVKEINSKNKQQQGMQAMGGGMQHPGGMAMGPGMGPGGMQNQGVVPQDPLISLAKMTSKGPGPGGAQQPGQPQPPQQQQHNVMQMPGPPGPGQMGGSQMGMVKQPQPPFSTYQQSVRQPQPPLQRQDAFIQMPGQVPGQMPGQVPGQMPMGPGIGPGQPGPMQGMPGGPQMPQQQYGTMLPPGVGPQGPQGPQPMGMQRPGMHPGPYGQSPHAMGPNVGQPGGQPVMMQQGLASPASVAHLQSPASFMPSPSPGGSTITPSPASRMMAMGAPGIPSPGTSINTPGNPASMGPAQSPAGATKEEMYLDKLRQLQKHVDPVKRMIAKIEKEEGREKDLIKMRGLLDMLTDSSKACTVPYTTLLKCEEVLDKMWHSHRPRPGTAPPKSEYHMCQPLMDAITSHINSPMLSHTLQRTFGPAVQALHGTPIRVPSPPAKKLKVEDKDEYDIPNLLQGEVARLAHRFKVDLDPLHHSRSKTVHLVCRLEDKNLPSVPPLSVRVPESYPDTSPTCDTDSIDYDATPFLQKVQKTLSTQLLCMPDKFSITALLDVWELSIRKACAPNAQSL